MVSPFVVGLTGGIGSGKTAVSTYFAAQGAHVIDTDLLARTLCDAGGAALPKLNKLLPADCFLPNGAMDREAVRHRVFTHPPDRLALEQILHPMILDAVQADLEQSTAPYTVLVVPLLFETKHFLSLTHFRLVIDCSPALQRLRIKARSALDDTIITQILAAQLTSAERNRLADLVVKNEGTLALLHEKLQPLHEDFLTRARAKMATKLV